MERLKKYVPNDIKTIYKKSKNWMATQQRKVVTAKGGNNVGKNLIGKLYGQERLEALHNNATLDFAHIAKKGARHYAYTYLPKVTPNKGQHYFDKAYDDILDLCKVDPNIIPRVTRPNESTNNRNT